MSIKSWSKPSKVGLFKVSDSIWYGYNTVFGLQYMKLSTMKSKFFLIALLLCV